MARLRIIVGPNGSGKTKVLKPLIEKHCKLGFYINADEIEASLNQHGIFKFNVPKKIPQWENNFEWIKYCNDKINHGILLKYSKSKNLDTEVDELINMISFNNQKISVVKKLNSYQSSFLCSFLKRCIIENRRTLTYETVGSHPSKYWELEYARQKGYKVYLYFICLDNPEMNINRVANRVKENGHSVPDIKIRERYQKCLDLLSLYVFSSNVYYIFNNDVYTELIVEGTFREEEVTIKPNFQKLKNCNWIKKTDFYHYMISAKG